MEILKKFGDPEEGADDPRFSLWQWALQHGFGDYFEVLLNIILEYTPLNTIFNVFFAGNA